MPASENKVIILPDGTEVEVAPGASEETVQALREGNLDAVASPTEVVSVKRKPLVRFVRLEDNDAVVIAQAFRWLAEGRGFVAPEEARILSILHDAFVMQKTMAVPKGKRKK